MKVEIRSAVRRLCSVVLYKDIGVKESNAGVKFFTEDSQIAVSVHAQ